MPDKSVFSWPQIVMSLGGGLAAAAVAAVLTKGTLGGLLLAHLAPLPIMIVALGFGLRHGATSAIVAAGLLSIWPHPMFGMAYGLLVALPAWIAAYVISGAPWGGRDLCSRHQPGWAALAVAGVLLIVVAGGLGVLVLQHGSLEAALNPYQARLYTALEKMNEMQPEDAAERLDPKRLQTIVAQSLRAIPATFAGHLLLVHILNLWGAARLCKASGLLTQPWPDIATQFVLPRWISILFVIGLGAALLDGFPGAIGFVVAITLGVALAMQGLAVLQALLRGYVTNTFVLTIIYFALGLLGWPIVLLGMAEAAFALRARKAASLAAKRE